MINLIKRARLIKGIKQRELADRLGVSVVAISKWEQGKTFPKVTRLKEVANALDTTVDELLKDRE